MKKVSQRSAARGTLLDPGIRVLMEISLWRVGGVSRGLRVICDQMVPCELCNMKESWDSIGGRDIWRHSVRLNMFRRGHFGHGGQHRAFELSSIHFI